MRGLRALGALVALTLVLVGVPVLLLGWGDLGPLVALTHPQTWTGAADARVLVGLVTALGWIAWAVLGCSIVLELIGQLSRGRLHWRPAALCWIQPLAAALVIAALVGLPGARSNSTEHAGPALRAPASAPAVISQQDPSLPGPDQPDAMPAAQTENLVPHVVVEGEDLWSLAIEWLGDGTAWRKIVAVNPGLDPRVDLPVGATVLIPQPMSTTARSTVPRVGVTSSHLAPSTVTVRSGDSLWRIAERVWGDGDRWPELFAANSNLIEDPDELEIGWTLVIPGPSESVSTAELSQRSVQPSAEDDQQRDDSGIGSASRAPRPAPPPMSVPEQAPPASTRPDTGRLTSDPVRLALGSLTAVLAAAVAASVGLRRTERLDQRAVGTRLTQLSGQTELLHSASRAAAPVGVGDPSPGCVVLGERPGGSPLLLDLEQRNWVSVGGDPGLGAELLGGIVTSLTCAPWSAQVSVLAVGPALSWAAGLDSAMLTSETSPVRALDRWEQIAAARRAAADGPAGPDGPLDVILVAEPPDPAHWERLTRATGAPGMAAVVLTGAPAASDQRPAVIELSSTERALLDGEPFTPQLIAELLRRALVELHQTYGSAEALQAPWWAEDEPPGSPPMINNRPELPDREEDPMTSTAPAYDGPPRLLVLGPVALLGARGRFPSRAVKQCEEYCGWLLEHPGRSSSAMVSSLLVAETTRRSNMSRLRSWLGESEDGEPYLPDAYTGRICLHPQVSSDWEELQLLIAGGVNRTTNQALVEGLSLVRGAPLADAAPGQWHWAEAWRQDMICTVRDMASVLAGRCLEGGDLDVARWAIRRGQLVAPQDELLAVAQIRVEYAAGNQQLVDRLVMQLTRTARARGMDLLDDTVVLLQQVIEGRSRSRQA